MASIKCLKHVWMTEIKDSTEMKSFCWKVNSKMPYIRVGLVTFARSDICVNDICTKWQVGGKALSLVWGKGNKLGEGER